MGSKINCDNCDADLTKFQEVMDFRLHLTCEPIPVTSKVIVDVMMCPFLDSEKFFCGFGCLNGWLKKK